MEGFKVIYNASVGLATTVDRAAELLADAYRKGHRSNVRVKVRTTLTRDRSLTADEQRDLIYRTATILAKEV